MSFRFALKSYLDKPDSFPDIVMYQDADFIVIKDQFPKALYHYLLLPKDSEVTKKNPLTVFRGNEELRKKASAIIAKFKQKIVDDLKQKHGISETLDFVKVGVHAVPSLYNLHIHIISKDFNSSRLKNKIHYNSFSTEFFVDFNDLPLQEDDGRLDKERMESLVKQSDLICLYCSKNFKNRFSTLKKHITEEFDERYSKD